MISDKNNYHKVLIVSTIASVIDQFNRNNIKILQKLNYDITILANFNFGNTTSDKKTEQFFNELIAQKIKVIDIPIPRKLKPLLLLRSYFIIKRLIKSENYSLIHCHTPIASMLIRINYLFKTGNNRGKIIYTAHGFHFYKGAPIINWFLYYPVEKLLSRYTDCLITINREDYKRAKKSFKETKSIFHINGVGVDTKIYFPISSEEEKIDYRKQYGYSKKEFIIISVAEINKNKNQILMVEAVKHLVGKRKNILVLLVGKGPEKEMIELIVKQYSLGNNVDFLGYRNDICRLLQISDLFVSCSRREGLPVSLIEAMAVGLPIIATDIRGNRDLIKNGSNGFLVSYNDPILLSEKMEKIIDSKEIRMEFANQNIKDVKQYSEEIINIQMKNIF
jgi:glycosyltransferase EpsD